MKRDFLRRWAAFGMALTMTTLSGCSSAEAVLPYAHEIEDAVLMGALGIDLGSESLDGVAVTASSSGRSGTGDSPGQELVILSSRAETVTAACAKMQTFGSGFIFYGDVEQVLVGEALAKRGIETLLTNMIWDPELRLECHIWIIRGGKAADILFDASGDGGAPDRLSAIELDADLLAIPTPRVGRAVLADLLDNGCTLLPALVRMPARTGDGAKGEHAVASGGYAVLRDSALVGWVEGTQTLGVDLILEESNGRMLEFTTPSQERVALKLSGVKTKFEPVFQEGLLVGLSIACELEAQVAELRGRDSLSEDSRSWLEEALKREAHTQLRSVLDLAQSLDADYLHLGRKAALSAPREKAVMEGTWTQAFPDLEISLSVTGKVARM